MLFTGFIKRVLKKKAGGTVTGNSVMQKGQELREDFEFLPDPVLKNVLYNLLVNCKNPRKKYFRKKYKTFGILISCNKIV